MARRADPETFLNSWVRFRMCRLRDEGYGFREIASKTGLPELWVRRVIRRRCPELYRMNLPRKLAWKVFRQYIANRPQEFEWDPYNPYPRRTRRSVEKEKQENHRRVAEIAKELKVSISTIWKAIAIGRKMWERRPPPRPPRR